MGIVERLRTPFGWQLLNVTKDIFDLGIAWRLRLGIAVCSQGSSWKMRREDKQLGIKGSRVEPYENH